jgi:hypothetical protein
MVSVMVVMWSLSVMLMTGTMRRIGSSGDYPLGQVRRTLITSHVMVQATDPP